MSKIKAEYHFKAVKKVKCTNEESEACLECEFSGPCQGYPSKLKSGASRVVAK